MIKKHIGESNILSYKKAASEEFSFNDVVAINASGYLTKADATTARSNIVGLIQKTVQSTDGDYADNSIVGVESSTNEEEFLMDVSTGSASDSDVGKRYDLDDENSINLNSQTYQHVEITRVLGSDQVVAKFVNEADTLIDSPVRLASYKETFSYDDMTDGGSDTGTYELDVTIPKGAIAVQAWIKDVTGFAGDTSATIQIGDGSDADRYNTSTPDVFSDADYVSAGVPSGDKLHTSDATPKVTITTDSDFSSVTDGKATIVLSWYELV